MKITTAALAVLLVVLRTAAEEGVDVGVLAGWCQAGSVVCDGGVVEGGEESCASACGGECCVGYLACSFFIGEVCKDGSCIGERACHYATIGRVKRSCQGDEACYHAGGFLVGGFLGELENSCNAKRACRGAADAGGSIVRIRDSCGKVDACASMATARGSIRTIDGSCNGVDACKGAAAGGSVDYLDGEVLYLYDYGSIGSIVGSCNGQAACEDAAAYGGNLPRLENACNAKVACKGAAKGGEICGVRDGCNARAACRGAGRDGSAVCPGFAGCCNDPEECQDADEAPPTCAANSGTTSKSKSKSKGGKSKSKAGKRMGNIFA